MGWLDWKNICEQLPPADDRRERDFLATRAVTVLIQCDKITISATVNSHAWLSGWSQNSLTVSSTQIVVV